MNIIYTMKLVVSLLIINGCSSGGSSENTNYEEVEFKYISPKMDTNKTENALMLAIGQSNMANSGSGLNYISSNNVQRIGSDYKLYLAESPVTHHILADASGGSFLPLLGDLLIEDDKYQTVTYANVSVGGTCIIQWTPENYEGYFYKIKETIEKGYEFSHIIFHQGECDTADWENTSIEDYKIRFLKMLQGIRELGINSPIYVARTSYGFGVVDPRIIQAQNELIKDYSDILEGPYTDVLGIEYRYDNAHFNEKGLREHARMWNELIE